MKNPIANELFNVILKKINSNKALKIGISLVLICLLIYEIASGGGLTQLVSSYLPTEATTAASSAPSADSEKSGLTITMLDVDQGDSMLISYNDHHMLIDTNVTAYYDNVKNTLKERGIDSLDYLIATHPHADHIGSMVYVLEDFDVDTYLYTECDTDKATYENAIKAAKKHADEMKLIAKGDKFTLGGDVKFTVLSPAPGYESDNVNNYSSVLHLQYGEFDALFTGDAETSIEKVLVEKGLVPDVELLKLGHHGSYTSSDRSFLKAANPEVSLISLGRDNEYGYPHQVTLDKLEEIDTEVYRTDLLGNITVNADKNGKMEIE